MRKETVSYEDYNGEKVTEDLYFNLNRTGWIRFDAKFENGMANAVKHALETNDERRMLIIFTMVVLASYGEKGEDGRHFIQNDAVSEKFSNSIAFDVFLQEILSDLDRAKAFLKGIVPPDVAKEIEF